MANIRIHTAADGSIKHKVQIRLKGFPPQYASFERKTDAKRWPAETEAAIRDGRYFKTSEARKRSLADLCNHYLSEVLPIKSATLQRDQKHLLAWWKACGIQR